MTLLPASQGGRLSEQHLWSQMTVSRNYISALLSGTGQPVTSCPVNVWYVWRGCLQAELELMLSDPLLPKYTKGALTQPWRHSNQAVMEGPLIEMC